MFLEVCCVLSGCFGCRILFLVCLVLCFTHFVFCYNKEPYIYRDSCLSNNFKQLQPAGLGAWVVPSGFVWMICLKVLVNRT